MEADGSPRHHLAQLNVGLIKAPLDTPQMAGFMSALDPINALADASPGFVWRLQTAAGDATEIRAFEDDRMLLNLSVWRDLQSLRDFVYASHHLDVMRRRRQWFHRLSEAIVALWWIEAGTVPTVDEALERVDTLRRVGPGPEAFTFKEPYPPPVLSTTGP